MQKNTASLFTRAISASRTARTVVGCALQVVGNARGKSGERALSRVLLRAVESGAWRVMRKIESSLRSRGGSEVSVKRIEVRKPRSPSRENGD